MLIKKYWVALHEFKWLGHGNLMEFFMTHHPNNLPILLIEMCIINAKKGIMMMNLILKGTMDGDG